MVHHYCMSIPTSPSKGMCNGVTVHSGHTHVYAYTYAHTRHTHPFTHVYIPHHPHSAVLMFCWFLFPSSRMTVDGSKWRLVYQKTNIWRNWILMDVMPSLSTCWGHSPWAGTPPYSSSILPVSHCTTSLLMTHSLSVYDVAVNSVPITSFLWEYPHTLPFVLYVPVWVSP